MKGKTLVYEYMWLVDGQLKSLTITGIVAQYDPKKGLTIVNEEDPSQILVCCRSFGDPEDQGFKDAMKKIEDCINAGFYSSVDDEENNSDTIPQSACAFA